MTSVDVSGKQVALKAIERDGTVVDAMTLTKATPTSVETSETEGPRVVSLTVRPAWPNPSSGETMLRFLQSRPSDVRVKLYDVSGRLVRVIGSGIPLSSGSHEIRWDGRDQQGQVVPAGVYFVKLTAAGSAVVRRAIFVQ